MSGSIAPRKHPSSIDRWIADDRYSLIFDRSCGVFDTSQHARNKRSTFYVNKMAMGGSAQTAPHAGVDPVTNEGNLFVAAVFLIGAGCLLLFVGWIFAGDYTTVAGSVLTGVGFICISLFVLEDGKESE